MSTAWWIIYVDQYLAVRDIDLADSYIMKKAPYHFLALRVDPFYSYEKSFDHLSKELCFGNAIDDHFNSRLYFWMGSRHAKLINAWKQVYHYMIDYTYFRPHKNWYSLNKLSEVDLINQPWFYCLKDSRQYVEK